MSGDGRTIRSVVSKSIKTTFETPSSFARPYLRHGKRTGENIRRTDGNPALSTPSGRLSGRVRTDGATDPSRRKSAHNSEVRECERRKVSPMKLYTNTADVLPTKRRIIRRFCRDESKRRLLFILRVRDIISTNTTKGMVRSYDNRQEYRSIQKEKRTYAGGARRAAGRDESGGEQMGERNDAA